MVEAEQHEKEFFAPLCSWLCEGAHRTAPTECEFHEQDLSRALLEEPRKAGRSVTLNPFSVSTVAQIHCKDTRGSK